MLNRVPPPIADQHNLVAAREAGQLQKSLIARQAAQTVTNT